MAKEEYKIRGYTISDIYQGGYSTLAPPENMYITAGSLGITTDPRTANVIQEVSSKLSSGVKQIEIEGVSPDIFDAIPKQHLKEVNRLSKLTGIDVSLHGPVMDVSGIDPRSGFSEAERENAERKVTDVLLRAHELNPDGNIPVNFHTAEGIPGSIPLPPSKRKITEEGKEEYRRLIVVNKETGQLAPLEPEIKFYPGMKEEEIYTPEKKMEILNESEWDNSLSQLFFNQERAQEILGKNQVQIQHLLGSIDEMRRKNIGEGEILKTLSHEQKQAYGNMIAAHNYLEDVHKQVNNFFSKAYEFGTPEQKNEIKELNNEIRPVLEELRKKGYNPFAEAEVMKDLVNDLKGHKFTPKMYVPIEEFAVQKSSQTFGNSAWEAYKKFKDKTPTLVIENPPAGFALSTGKDVANLVRASREQFIKKATEEGMSESHAREQAEKLIGATWDVGHINMLRKYGYSEKEIIAEAEKIAPFVKHVHLSDNFGFEHTELPMGMGNVPLKEIMEKLGQKGFDARKIIEAGHWWQHFRTPPFQEVLESTGSPIYGMKMAPYWSQSPGLYQGYFGGYGQMLPQINYETFGAGFSRLPSELGGQSPGAQGSRMSGRPME